MAAMQTRLKTGKATPNMTGRNASAATNVARGSAEMDTKPAPGICAQERELLVSQRAYFRTERRGLAPGRYLQDWSGAVAEVELLLI